MNILLKLRKTAVIALCELLAIATIFTGCASTDLSGTEGAGHAAGAVVAGEDSSGALGSKDKADGPQEDLVNNNSYVSLDAIPAYDGRAYVAVNNNEPFFTDSDMTTTAFENYSDLDSLGRCGVAYANICKDIMPTEERGKIGMIKPSGWHTVKYDVIKDRYLYNRCHLIGYQLAGENANPKNLITGTRYLNVEGMLPFENLVADYVNNTGNHVLYRVTPMFSGSNLVANGVLIEAKSVEDNGGGILFNVYCYNVQPGVGINYENGDSWLDGTTGSASSGSDSSAAENSAANSSNSETMVHITATGKKYHRAGCRTLKKSDTEVTLDEAKSMGLSPCGICNPPQ
ncbi:MAG: DNA/RNA non-specific endonuclease [Agathobacter rectalis]